MDAVGKHVEVERPKPELPGPFSFGDAARVRTILEDAGFTAVALESLDETVAVGGQGTLDEIAANMTQFGFVGGAIRRAGVKDTTQIEASIKQAVAPFATDNRVHMTSGTWIVTARRA